MLGIIAAALFLGKALSGKNTEPDQSKTVSSDSSSEIQNDEDNLPALSEFESPMNNAVIEYNGDYKLYTPDWKAVYADVLDALIRDFPELEDMCNYTLYDIDENGIPELFVKNCNVFHVYGFSEQSETLIDLGELDASAWHGSICGIEGKNQFLVWGVQQFYEIITLVTLQDDRLVEKTIFEDAVENEHELSPLKVYDLADRSGLMKWAGNESEQNLFALTNYQKIAYDQGGKQYEEKDEQLHISSTDRYDEQMWRPIFSDFVNAHFSGKQVDWNFVGRNNNGDYDLNQDGYEDCILIFSVMDGNQQGYYVMPYGEIPAPEVYILKPDGTFRLVWEGQYEDYYDEELLHPQW